MNELRWSLVSGVRDEGNRQVASDSGIERSFRETATAR
jgi:hypothetical protein